MSVLSPTLTLVPAQCLEMGAQVWVDYSNHNFPVFLLKLNSLAQPPVIDSTNLGCYSICVLQRCLARGMTAQYMLVFKDISGSPMKEPSFSPVLNLPQAHL